jgi:hypothetical protein
MYLSALMERKGTSAIARAQNVVTSLGKRGDALAAGLTKAVGLTLTSNFASPQLYGKVVTFTATGSGKDTGTTYNYRFSIDGVVVQAWAATATYPTEATLAAGTHTVTVDVTTEAVISAPQKTVSVTYVIAKAEMAVSVTAGDAIVRN